MNLHVLDFAVLLAYGVTVIVIGVVANRSQKSTEDYFLGGRHLRWWAVGVSILATSFSSVSLIGGTGAGFRSGMGWLQWQIGDLLAVILVILFFIPLYSRLRVTTAYEFLESRFGVVARSTASLLFIIQTLLRTGLLVYAPALALATIFGGDIETMILVTAAAAILYSCFGGISAVVWTDLIQVCVIVAGVIFSVLLIGSDVPGGLTEIAKSASQEGRLTVVSLEWNPKSPFNLWWTLIAYGTLALSIFGTNQQAVQRYMSCEDLGQSRRALLLGWAVGALIMLLTLVLGVCLWSWSRYNPQAFGKGDAILPTFILHRLPPGMAGLMIAAIFAASMSSIDSAIHAVSTTTMVDFVRRFRRSPLPAETELTLARWLTCAFGILATLAALGAVRMAGAKGLLDTMVTWMGLFAGPLLGLFVLGLFSRRVGELGAMLGVAVGAAGMIVAFIQELPKQYGFHPLWLAPMALFATVGVGLIASLLSSPSATTTSREDGSK